MAGGLLSTGKLIAEIDDVNQRNPFHVCIKKQRIGEDTNKADAIGIYIVPGMTLNFLASL